MTVELFPVTPRLLSSTPSTVKLLSRDRKSTRLNSSHGYISYAVFCLKKKNLHGCVARLSVSRGSGVEVRWTSAGRPVVSGMHDRLLVHSCTHRHCSRDGVPDVSPSTA